MMTAAAAAALAIALASAGPAVADCWYEQCDGGYSPTSSSTTATTSSPTSILTNGGFESPDIATGSWSLFSSIPGWTATNSCGIEVQDHVAGDPAQGGQFVELNANCPGEISSPALPMTVGRKYRLAFKFSPRPGTPAEANVFKVRINGSVTTYAPGAGGSTTSWTETQWDYTSFDYSKSTITVQFIYAGTSPYAMGAYIDDVRLFKY